MEKWKYISSKYYYKSAFGNLRCDKVELPNGRIIEEYNICEYPEWICGVAVTRDGGVLLERQYRHALGEVALEIPAGTIEEGETPAEAMTRELEEETGYTSPHPPIPLGVFATNPARNNNRMHLFLYTDCERTSETHFDDTEEIELIVAPSFDAVEELIASGELNHQTCVLAIERARRTLGI